MTFVKMCIVGGCPDDAIQGSNRCAAHQRPKQFKKRSPVAWIYATARWARARKFVLKRDSYTCALCGRNEVELGGTQHLLVDHVGGDYSDPFNPEKLRTLCRSCSGREDGGRAGRYSGDGPVGRG